MIFLRPLLTQSRHFQLAVAVALLLTCSARLFIQFTSIRGDSFVSMEAGLVETDFPLGGASILAVKFAACIAALALTAVSPVSAQTSSSRPNIVR